MKNIIIVLIALLPNLGFTFPITGFWNAKLKSTNHELMLYITDSGTFTIRCIELDPVYPQCKPDVKLFDWKYILNPQSNDISKIKLVDPNSGTQTEFNIEIINGRYTAIDSFYLSGHFQHILSLLGFERIQFKRVSQIMADRAIRYVYQTNGGGIVEQLVQADKMSSSSTFKNLRLKNRIVDLNGQVVRSLDTQICRITNAFRNANNESTLIYESSLDSAAQKQVVYLAKDWIKKKTRYLSHIQEIGSEFYTGETVADRIGLYNKLSMSCGENILYTTMVPDNIANEDPKKIKSEKIKELAQQMVKQWENSLGHRSNMLNTKYQSIGCKTLLVGYQYDDYYINVNGEKIHFNASFTSKESYVIIAAQVFSTIKN
jgi:uncharacterized protein YkwD